MVGNVILAAKGHLKGAEPLLKNLPSRCNRGGTQACPPSRLYRDCGRRGDRVIKNKGNKLTGNLQEKQVVTCFLESGGEILLLRRSQQVGSYRGRWAGVSGYLEATPDEQALTEIAEETGLSGEDITLVRKGAPLTVEDEKLGTRWIVHPFLFQIKDRSKIRIDWEHKEVRWIAPEDIGGYETVPMLKETLDRVYY